MKNKIAIAGAGLSGAVLARQIAENSNLKVVVFESRHHLGGNCHTERDPKTGIMIHKYGPHIFHTNSKRVWQFVSRFNKFYAYVHRGAAITPRGYFDLPINLPTINKFFKKEFTAAQAKTFIESLTDKSIRNPKNFQEIALKTVGRELYDNFYYGYTKKQWGIEPSGIPLNIFNRLPVRFNNDASYFNNSKYQGIPFEGYTVMIARMLDHPQIEVLLNRRLEPEAINDFRHLFWAGPLDSFFNYKYGRQRYRTSFWMDEYSQSDYQMTSIINYTDYKIPYTRIIEPKFFMPWEKYQSSIYQREFSKTTGLNDIPCYPMRFEKDLQLLSKYQQLALATDRVSFFGRLGTFSYLDMDQAINQAIELSEKALLTLVGSKLTIPTFPESAGVEL